MSRNLGYEFISNASDDAILVQLFDEFHTKDKEEQEEVIGYILGALEQARTTAGYGKTEIGK